MNQIRNELSLKLAWQAAHETRCCPDYVTLLGPLDNNLKKHLNGCHSCRVKRAMQQDEKAAWHELKDKFTALTAKSAQGINKQVRQVWSIKKEFGGWRSDGSFLQPPTVLLLEKLPGKGAWKVVQLYSDKRLMADGDVELADCFGFAQPWNCYTMKEDRFACCLGVVTNEQIGMVQNQATTSHEPAPQGSIISFFRMTEVEVGASVATPAVVELVEEWGALNESMAEIAPGIKLAVSEVKGFVLDIAASALEILRQTYRPALVLRGGGAGVGAESKLDESQDAMLSENGCIVPIKLVLDGETLSLDLKMLGDNQPESVCSPRLITNSVEPKYLQYTHNERAQMLTLTCRDHNLGGLAISRLNNINISKGPNGVLVQITFTE